MQLNSINNQNTFGSFYFNEVSSPVLRKALSKQVKTLKNALKDKDVFVRDSLNSLSEAFTGVTVFIKKSDNASVISFIPGQFPFTKQKLQDFVKSIVHAATSSY